MKRDRSTGSLTTHTTMVKVYHWNQPDENLGPFGVWPMGARRSTQDHIVPGFYKGRNDGIIYNNPFSTKYEQYGFTPGTRVVATTTAPPFANGTPWKTSRTANGGVGTNAIPLSIDSPRLITQACTKALANVGAPQVLGLAMLAQLQQTLATLRDPLQGISRAIARLKSKKGATLGHLSKDMADQHLAVIYGILPLMGDVSGIVKALTTATSKRYTARGFASESKASAPQRTYNDGQVSGPVQQVFNRTLSVRSYALYELNVTLADRLGFSYGSLPATVLELTPWSFVLDWFVNLQDLIEALTPRFGINYLAEGYTIQDVGSSVEQLGDLTAVTPGWKATGGGDIATYSYIAKERVVTKMADHVGLTWRPRLNVSTITAAISLIVSNLPDPKTNVSKGDRRFRHLPKHVSLLRFT